MTDPLPLLALLRRELARHMPPDEAARAAIPIFLSLEDAEIPTGREFETIRRDLRILEFVRQGVSAEVVALRIGCDRATVYRAQTRALALKRAG